MRFRAKCSMLARCSHATHLLLIVPHLIVLKAFACPASKLQKQVPVRVNYQESRGCRVGVIRSTNEPIFRAPSKLAPVRKQ